MSDQTIVVSFDESNGVFSYQGLDNLRVGPRNFEAVFVPAGTKQTIKFVPDSSTGAWAFVGMNLLGAEGMVSWRTVGKAAPALMSNESHNLVVIVADDMITVVDENTNKTEDSIGVRFQITVRVGERMYTSHDPQIINEKDGSGTTAGPGH